MILLVMGVSGCGKTTVGTELAKRLGWPFADADDFHSQGNKIKMADGCPLSDKDRIPWLLSLHEQIDKWSSSGVNAVLACSALKRSYRHILLFGLTEENFNDVGKEVCRNLNQPQQLKECGVTGVDSSLARSAKGSFEWVALQKCLHGLKNSLLFVFLKTSQEALMQRLKERSGHYMPSSLLQSQLETLEEPDYPEQFIMLDGDKSVSQIIEESLAATNRRYDLLNVN